MFYLEECTRIKKNKRRVRKTIIESVFWEKDKNTNKIGSGMEKGLNCRM